MLTAIVGSVIHTGPNGRRFTLYQIRVREAGKEWEVNRRYNEFLALDQELATYNELTREPLPPKGLLGIRHKFRLCGFEERRQEGLERYMLHLVQQAQPKRLPAAMKKFLLRDNYIQSSPGRRSRKIDPTSPSEKLFLPPQSMASPRLIGSTGKDSKRRPSDTSTDCSPTSSLGASEPFSPTMSMASHGTSVAMTETFSGGQSAFMSSSFSTEGQQYQHRAASPSGRRAASPSGDSQRRASSPNGSFASSPRMHRASRPRSSSMLQNSLASLGSFTSQLCTSETTETRRRGSTA